MSMIAPEKIATPGLKGQELLWLQVMSGCPLPQKSHVHSGYMYTNEGHKCEVTKGGNICSHIKQFCEKVNP